MNGIVDIDKGFYREARNKGLTAPAYLAEQVHPEPAEIDKTFQRVLSRYGAKDDGSARSHMLFEFAQQLTALEKELAARGIRTRGPGSDRVEKFFSSANDTALFPVYLATQIIAGQLEASIVPALVTTEIRIDSHIAEKITLNDTAGDRTLHFIGEGADLPKTKISRTDTSIKLYKYGRLLEATYEAVRLMHLDIFGLMLQRMGAQIGIDQSDDLIETLIAGDGTASSAVTDTDAEVSGTLDYDELIRLSQAFLIGYQMRHTVINDTNLRTVLNMAEFKDPLAGFNFQRTGQFMNALGAMWHRWTSTGSTSFSTDRILAVDSVMAAALFREGDLLEEADQLIEKQLHQRSMTEWVGFMKLDNNATQCLDITT